MRRLREIFRYVLTLVTTIVLAATPSVQAYQINQVAGSCSSYCCCGCSCVLDKAVVIGTTELGHSCNCKMSAPEPVEEITFETQFKPVNNPDNYAELTVSGLEGDNN